MDVKFENHHRYRTEYVIEGSELKKEFSKFAN